MAVVAVGCPPRVVRGEGVRAVGPASLRLPQCGSIVRLSLKLRTESRDAKWRGSVLDGSLKGARNVSLLLLAKKTLRKVGLVIFHRGIGKQKSSSCEAEILYQSRRHSNKYVPFQPGE